MSTGGLGMMDAISQRGMEAEVPLSKRMAYEGEIQRIVGGGINRERNVHDSTGEEHVGSRVKPFDPSARRIQFLDGRIVVAIK